MKLIFNKFTPKPATICNKVWPASMLANNRTDKLTGRIKYDIISMQTIKGNIATGTPEGTNNCKNWDPCRTNPSMHNPIKNANAIKKVNAIWLVGVKAYGVNPKRLQNNIKPKVKKNNGKN